MGFMVVENITKHANSNSVTNVHDVNIILNISLIIAGQDCAVSITTRYRLDGLGIKSW
jgi:hypothetical protein